MLTDFRLYRGFFRIYLGLIVAGLILTEESWRRIVVVESDTTGWFFVGFCLLITLASVCGAVYYWRKHNLFRKEPNEF